MIKNQNIITGKKYIHKYSLQRELYSIPSIDETSSIEKNLFGPVYNSSYNEIKKSLKEDFEKKVESVHAKYESQVIDVLLKTLSELDSEVSNLNRKLTNTINTITKAK